MFKKQLDHIKKNYEILSLNEYIKYSEDIADNIHRPAALITFDDGWKDNYTNAFPALRSKNIPATIFLTTGYIGTNRLFWPERLSNLIHAINACDLTETQQINYLLEMGDKLFGANQYKFLSNNSSIASEVSLSGIVETCKKLSSDHIENVLNDIETKYPFLKMMEMINTRSLLSWKEVREMAGKDISFGAHTRNHILLDRVSSDVLLSEIAGSKFDIEEKIEQEVVAFAYPNGNYNKEVSETVGNAGFKVSFTTEYGMNIKGTPSLKNQRIRVDNSFSATKSGKFSPCLFEFNTWRHSFKMLKNKP
ncbi:MAG: polysaccharide deacetylase family protein [Desulfobacteraceae bacterium]|nr:polysaccharide deacetylase family protein [Desulfobacteraceae bacterium]MBC2749217.1 polysaccharide deacetylase family protein [Desulfobacteraceae bacterium]